MVNIRGIGLTLLLLTLAYPSSVRAQQRPFIFLLTAKNETWWMSTRVFKLEHKSASSVNVDALNALMRGKAGWSDVCYLQNVQKDSYIGLNRSSDVEYRNWVNSKKNDPFKLSFSAGSQKLFSASVISYETCDGEVGLGVLVTEGTRPREFRYFRADAKDENSALAWIYPFETDYIAMAGCDECGDQSVLRYDSGQIGSTGSIREIE